MVSYKDPTDIHVFVAQRSDNITPSLSISTLNLSPAVDYLGRLGGGGGGGGNRVFFVHVSINSHSDFVNHLCSKFSQFKDHELSLIGNKMQTCQDCFGWKVCSCRYGHVDLPNYIYSAVEA